MKKLVVLFITALFLTACGTGTQDGDDVSTGSGGNNDNGDSQTDGGGVAAGEMVPAITENGTLLFQYIVKNQTENEITLEFSSGQRFDYSVETQDGEEIYLFSSVAMFIQEIGEEVIGPGEELIYDIDLNELSLEPEDYVLTAWMTPMEGKKFEATSDFTVE
ncbi:BsuPI-related putative proteinase inhibitor [Evansella tamaricis]|uniref:Intracellular proteinase inhibitor BsuPI domain-containing protein n=1 Tax=Evansella tamaricis TaxID=2069301 RepID=A0ABS6JHM0_9BACI|nr:BsuPI-related putative proteinase inhibitor [Evansella tamaricis]MBU9712890.1 hypothetical protein [Evansella tamaricis]